MLHVGILTFLEANKNVYQTQGKVFYQDFQTQKSELKETRHS